MFEIFLCHFSRVLLTTHSTALAYHPSARHCTGRLFNGCALVLNFSIKVRWIYQQWNMHHYSPCVWILAKTVMSEAHVHLLTVQRVPQQFLLNLGHVKDTHTHQEEEETSHSWHITRCSVWSPGTKQPIQLSAAHSESSQGFPGQGSNWRHNPNL